MAKLKISNLSFARNQQLIVSDLSFELLAGDALVLQGANGAGKTTLLKILAGLIQPDQGKIQYLDATSDLTSNSAIEPGLVNWLGVKNALKLEWSAWQNLQFITNLRGLDADSKQQDLLLALDQVGLFRQRHQAVGNFSVGMQRRLALAGLALSQAKIWLLDEPQTGLDADGVMQFEEILAKHLAAGGLAVIASHQALQQVAYQTLQLGELVG